MPRRDDISSVLIIGSGPIVIGQACEFDYSGTQAVKALKEEGYRVILVNSNPATIMTDPEFADRTYIEPITLEYLTEVIKKERPDALLPTIGGQTALNATLELDEAGVLEQYGVETIGASPEAIMAAEDRAKFKEIVTACGLESARSFVVTDIESAHRAIEELGFPVILRPSRTLGGSGGAIVNKASEVDEKLRLGFDLSPVNELLVEESLLGWKEFELEIMRDCAGNGVVICSIENLDPMGVHTGDSITVAPIQTLTDKEYQLLRNAALRLMNKIGVDTGGSNVQFAVNPDTGRVIVIEVNPRVSRSSALASKATGFPIAKIAAKLAVGYTLDELPNDITKKTPACFEPSIDYVVVKIPRFNFEKFPGVSETLGTQMKSVGEAMAIARSFPEALQKACRSLEVERSGLLGGPESKETELQNVYDKLKQLLPTRIFWAGRALELGASVEQIYEITHYDRWFLEEMRRVVELEAELRSVGADSDQALVTRAKRLGTSDMRMAELFGIEEREVTARRHQLAIRPVFKSVDTCAAEFESYTPYFYSNYDSSGDAPPSTNKKIIILGGGPNRIGQGIEFDYCCVHAAMELKEAGFETIMVNCNPETVSTDYDTSDRLYFEPLTLEDVTEIIDREQPHGVIVQYGGQTPLRLAIELQERGAPIIGTSPQAIESSEDRDKFRELLVRLGLRQSESGVARNKAEAREVAERVGFPALVRPSYVLGGRAMAIVHDFGELDNYIEQSVSVSFERPVLIDRFLHDAIEVDVDAVSDGEDVVVCGIMEHIERAGIHSGDSSFILPSQTLSPEVINEIANATRALALECGVVGLMNVQYAVCRGSEVYVIEVNPRASRSVPFVSKVLGVSWAKVAARVMAGETLAEIQKSGRFGDILKYSDYASAIKQIEHVAIKRSVFPFIKFYGIDTVLGPEMRSTGEVMGIDSDAVGGFRRAQSGAGFSLPVAGTVFLSLRNEDKNQSLPFIKKLSEMNFQLVATAGTQKFLAEQGLDALHINKVRDGSPHIVDALREGEINLVINTPEGSGPMLDSASIRSTTTSLGLPLFTTVAAASVAVDAIKRTIESGSITVRSVQEYLEA